MGTFHNIRVNMHYLPAALPPPANDDLILRGVPSIP